jgi:DNA-binding IclR family transcriptional regulator
MKPNSGGDAQSEKILAYLSHDLKTRSGSYIGQTTNRIADAVDIDAGLVNTVLHTLAAHGRVHNTINDDTWVISEPTKELPPIEQEPQPPEPSDDYLFTPAGQFTLAGWIVSCLIRNCQGLSLEDLAFQLQAPSSRILTMIHRLAQDGYIASGPDEHTWILTDLGEQKALEIRVREERDAKRVTELPPNENPPSDLSERALSYLKSLPGISENISDLAATFDIPVAELRPVLDKLESEGLVENKDDRSS